LHFKGCPFHRIQSGFVAQGGDVTRFDGSGGESIYGKKFNDEKDALKLKHDAPGVVAMANSGKNSNSSQFFVTLQKAPQCDGKHVVIGRVTPEGLPVVAAIAAAGSASGAPAVMVVVADCGVL
jgi:peptidylprolyl isomerase